MNRDLENLIRNEKLSLQDSERELNYATLEKSRIENKINEYKSKLQQKEYELNNKKREHDAASRERWANANVNTRSSIERLDKYKELERTCHEIGNNIHFLEKETETLKSEIKDLEVCLKMENDSISHYNSEKEKSLRSICNLESEFRQVERDNSASSSRGFRP